MKYFLCLVSVAFFLLSLIVEIGAHGAIQEIEALILLLISTIFFCTSITIRQLAKVQPAKV